MDCVSNSISCNLSCFYSCIIIDTIESPKEISEIITGIKNLRSSKVCSALCFLQIVSYSFNAERPNSVTDILAFSSNSIRFALDSSCTMPSMSGLLKKKSAGQEFGFLKKVFNILYSLLVMFSYKDFIICLSL